MRQRYCPAECTVNATQYSMCLRKHPNYKQQGQWNKKLELPSQTYLILRLIQIRFVTFWNSKSAFFFCTHCTHSLYCVIYCII